MIKRNLQLLMLLLISCSTFGQKLTTKTGHIKFFSTTSVENIESNNYKVTGTLSKEDGKMVFSVPMQSFEFEKAMMQKHFNQPNYLDTKKFPKAKFVGKIEDNSKVNYNTEGVYEVTVSGELTLHGVTKPVTSKGTIEVAPKSNVKGVTKFDILLADYDIVFDKGKPSKSIAKTVEVTVNMDYSVGR